MIILRLHSTKKGKIRFASHRDIAKVWERALRRANIPLIYSEGFSPRPKIAFGLALPTGAESECEYLDVQINNKNIGASLIGEIPETLNSHLPEGIRVTGMVEIEKKTTSLQQAVTSCLWEITVEEDQGIVDSWIHKVINANELRIERSRKGKVVTDDIRPFISNVHASGIDREGYVVLEAELRTQPRSLRPNELIKSAKPHLTQLKLCRKKQFIKTGDGCLDPLDVGTSPDMSMEVCSV